MNKEIKCKAIFLTRAFKRLIIISLVVSVLLFLGLNIDLSYRYFLSMLFVFTGLLVVFYQNRYELEKLKIQDENIELSFFNKVFFKRKPIQCKKQGIEVQIQEDIITLYKAKQIIAKVRNSSVNKDDWNKLESYFVL